MREITLTISKKDYTVRLDDDFAEALERDIANLLGGKTNFEVKDLLFAFMKKCQDQHENDKRMNNMVNHLSKTLNV